MSYTADYLRAAAAAARKFAAECEFAAETSDPKERTNLISGAWMFWQEQKRGLTTAQTSHYDDIGYKKPVKKISRTV